MTTKSQTQKIGCGGAGVGRTGGSQWCCNIAAEALPYFYNSDRKLFEQYVKGLIVVQEQSRLLFFQPRNSGQRSEVGGNGGNLVGYLNNS